MYDYEGVLEYNGEGLPKGELYHEGDGCVRHNCAVGAGGCNGFGRVDGIACVMVYDYDTPGDGQWHCPYPMEWLERMARAAKHCNRLTAEQIDASDNSQPGYKVPPGDFPDGPQDVRGLPLWWCDEEERRFKEYPASCYAIYDYDTVPDVVITNGEDDWPLRILEPLLTA